MLQKQSHVINKVQVDVTAMKPRQWQPVVEGPLEERVVLLSGLSPKCQEYDLERFFSTANDCGEMERLIFSQEAGVVLVQFTQPPGNQHYYNQVI